LFVLKNKRRKIKCLVEKRKRNIKFQIIRERNVCVKTDIRKKDKERL